MGGCITHKKEDEIDDTNQAEPSNLTPEGADEGGAEAGVGRTPLRSFAFDELSIVTGAFDVTNKIGQGGFGKVYRAGLDTGEIVAIKQLTQGRDQGSGEFMMEVLLLSVLDHPNLVNLIGYCTEGVEKLLVYEYMPRGSLADRIVGFSAPEYIQTGLLTVNMDVYSFGVVLLELITWKPGMDYRNPRKQQSLAKYCQSYFKDRNSYEKLADPALQGRYKKWCLNAIVNIAKHCLYSNPYARPSISDVRRALELLASHPYRDPDIPEASGSGS